jgi:hypothetical protein
MAVDEMTVHEMSWQYLYILHVRNVGWQTALRQYLEPDWIVYFLLFYSLGSCLQDGIRFDFPSSITRIISVASAVVCQYQCQITATCIRMLYYKDSKDCYLTAASNGPIYLQANAVSGPKYCTGKK